MAFIFYKTYCLMNYVMFQFSENSLSMAIKDLLLTLNQWYVFIKMFQSFRRCFGWKTNLEWQQVIQYITKLRNNVQYTLLFLPLLCPLHEVIPRTNLPILTKNTIGYYWIMYTVPSVVGSIYKIMLSFMSLYPFC